MKLTNINLPSPKKNLTIKSIMRQKLHTLMQKGKLNVK